MFGTISIRTTSAYPPCATYWAVVAPTAPAPTTVTLPRMVFAPPQHQLDLPAALRKRFPNRLMITYYRRLTAALPEADERTAAEQPRKGDSPPLRTAWGDGRGSKR